VLEQQSPPGDPVASPATTAEYDRTAARLAWHIPSHVSAARWNVKSLRVLLSGLVALAVGVAISAGPLSWPVLAIAALTIAVLAYYWYSRSRRAAASDTENVWLDREGLHWNDGAAEGSLLREQIEGFRVGLDPDTVRAIPALTLILVGGFESQPIELHAPATPASVRTFLADHWRLAEVSLDAQRQADLLYRACETALCESPSPGEAEYLLLACLLQPQRCGDGTWTVFRLPGEIEVDYDPGTARLRVAKADAQHVERLAALVQYVDQSVLPESAPQREQMLAAAEEAASEAYARNVRADARQLQLRIDRDEADHRWSIEGSRSSLAAMCDRIEAAAQGSPPPPGARPMQLRLGGLYYGVTFEVNRYEGIADDVLCATPETFGDLAEQFRRQLSDSRTGDSWSLPFSLGGVRWAITVTLRDDNFDPAGFV
jgi:hypothetical protein